MQVREPCVKCVAVSEEPRVRRATDCIFQVPARPENGRKKFHSPMTQARHRPPIAFPTCRGTGRPVACGSEWLQLFKDGLSGEPSESHNLVVEQAAGEPKEKTPEDFSGKLQRKVNRSSFCRKWVQESTHNKANWQAQLHMFLKIRIGTFANSQTTRVSCSTARTADHKVLNDENESRGSKLPNEELNCARNDEMFPTVRAANSKTMYFHADNSVEFIRACEDLCWNCRKAKSLWECGKRCWHLHSPFSSLEEALRRTDCPPPQAEAKCERSFTLSGGANLWFFLSSRKTSHFCVT